MYEIHILIDNEWMLYHEFMEYENIELLTYGSAEQEAKYVSSMDGGYVFAIGVNGNEPSGRVLYLNGDQFIITIGMDVEEDVND